MLNISVADGKIWFRNYQVRTVLLALVTNEALMVRCIHNSQILNNPPPDLEAEGSSSTGAKAKARKDAPKMSLNEIGPRFVLQPVKIFEGSFNGATLFENKGEDKMIEKWRCQC